MSKLSKQQESLVTRVNIRPEKTVRDVVRLEIAALLYLARTCKSDFLKEIMDKATVEQKGWIKDEMKKLESMLRTKAEAKDEA